MPSTTPGNGIGYGKEDSRKVAIGRIISWEEMLTNPKSEGKKLFICQKKKTAQFIKSLGLID